MVKAGDLVSYDPSGTFREPAGISPDDIAAIAPRLEQARREFTDINVRLPTDGDDLSRQSCEATFFALPETMLDDYVDGRESSELGRILSTASRLREAVDRVVILSCRGSCLAIRAVLDACCEPYFNELSRGQRGSRPRIYFAGNDFDNDAAVGLLKLLTEGRSFDRLDDRWAIIAISAGGDTIETQVAVRQWLAALRTFCGSDAGRMSPLVVPVTEPRGRLFDLAEAMGCGERFSKAGGVSGSCSVLSPAGLLPAAVVGLDVVRLLEGASAMNDHFRSAPPGRNAVLDFVGVGHLMECKRRARIRVLQIWARALTSVGHWYGNLLSERPGNCRRMATPLTVTDADGYSRARRHQRGRRNPLITNLILDRGRCDPWHVGRSERDEDLLYDRADRTLPELMRAAIRRMTEACRSEGRPAADIRVPQLNEYTLGQLLQMFMIATAIEGRLCERPTV